MANSRGRILSVLLVVSGACGGSPMPAPTGQGRERERLADALRSSDARVRDLGRATRPEIDPQCNRELAALEAPLDRGDFAEADLALARVEKACPSRRSAPLAAGARVRFAKGYPALEFAASPTDPVLLAIAHELEAAVLQEPQYGGAWLDLGRAWLLRGSADAAGVALARAAQLLPTNAEAHSAHGIALLARGDLVSAYQALKRAVELDPDNADRRLNFATVLMMRSEVGPAIEQFRLVVSAKPDSAVAASDLGTAYLAAKDYNAALPHLERAARVDPKRATFRSNLGFAYQNLGEIDRARREYEKALDLDPHLVSAMVNLATILARGKTTRQKARYWLEKASQIDPADPRVRANLEELDALERTRK